MQVGEWDAIERHVEIGLGVAFFPSFCVTDGSRVSVVPLERYSSEAELCLLHAAREAALLAGQAARRGDGFTSPLHKGPAALVVHERVDAHVHVPWGALVEVAREGDGGRRTRLSGIPDQPAEGAWESAEASGSEAVVNRMNRSAGGDSGWPWRVKTP